MPGRRACAACARRATNDGATSLRVVGLHDHHLEIDINVELSWLPPRLCVKEIAQNAKTSVKGRSGHRPVAVEVDVVSLDTRGPTPVIAGIAPGTWAKGPRARGDPTVRTEGITCDGVVTRGTAVARARPPGRGPVVEAPIDQGENGASLRMSLSSYRNCRRFGASRGRRHLGLGTRYRPNGGGAGSCMTGLRNCYSGLKCGAGCRNRHRRRYLPLNGNRSRGSCYCRRRSASANASRQRCHASRGGHHGRPFQSRYWNLGNYRNRRGCLSLRARRSTTNASQS